jgi:hypothetical protein
MVILRATSILRRQRDDKGMICSIPHLIMGLTTSTKKVINPKNYAMIYDVNPQVMRHCSINTFCICFT